MFVFFFTGQLIALDLYPLAKISIDCFSFWKGRGKGTRDDASNNQISKLSPITQPSNESTLSIFYFSILSLLLWESVYIDLSGRFWRCRRVRLRGCQVDREERWRGSKREEEGRWEWGQKKKGNRENREGNKKKKAEGVEGRMRREQRNKTNLFIVNIACNYWLTYLSMFTSSGHWPSCDTPNNKHPRIMSKRTGKETGTRMSLPCLKNYFCLCTTLFSWPTWYRCSSPSKLQLMKM